jgi:ssDNA-binding replication factor A large subunit
MIQQNYDSILNKIIAKTAMSKSDVEARITSKLEEMQDLISKEGAAHIIANELKVKLFDNQPKDLKLKDVLPGENSLNVVGKVLFVNEPREFISKGRKGRVASVQIADETAQMRLTIWDEKIIDQLKELNQGDIIKIHNSYSRRNNNFTELHLGSKSQLTINPDGIKIENVATKSKAAPAERKKVSDLVDNEFAELFGTVVQIFEPRYYQACPVCNKKVNLTDTTYSCGEHGEVSPTQVPIVNIILDDGTGNIRAVCFREEAEKLIGKEMTNFDETRNKVLGKQVILKGKVIRNEMFDRVEFRISSVEDAKPEPLVEEMQM